MHEPAHAIAQLVQEDRRYAFEAYALVFDALRYAQTVMGLGTEVPGETLEPSEPETPESGEGQVRIERHVTGQELCEAIRRYALEQYGYMAKTVLNNWGLHKTGDFGEIVFNLIRIEQMRKTPADTRADFDNVYDFDAAFRQGFKIELPEDK